MTQQEFQTRYTYHPSTDKLGEGGFGSVFKAYNNYRDRWVALKISKVNLQYETIRLRKEVEMVAKLPAHPNIAYYEECYTIPQLDGEYDFGILQYYEEGNLSQLLKNNTLTLEKKQAVLMQILEGVHFLHNNGIIHRDLKPQNILIVKRGTEYIPKITDFGISKQLDINKSSVFSNSIAGAGTLAYSSPEQLFDREIRKNTDLWSFGVIVFQTFTGQLPFTTGSHATTSEAGRMELFRQVNNGQLPAITAHIAEPWQTVIRRCLVTDASMRVKNTKEAADILTSGRGEARHNPTETRETDEQTRIDPSKTKFDDCTITDLSRDAIPSTRRDVAHHISKKNTPKKRNVFVTFWMWLMIVVSTLDIIRFFSELKYFSNNPQNLVIDCIWCLSLLAIIVFVFLLLHWKKIGFWGIVGSIVITTISVFIVPSIIPRGDNVISIDDYVLIIIIGMFYILPLFAILQIKKEGVSCWKHLK